MNDELMTSQEVADFLKINIRKVYDLRNTGELPSHMIGASVRFLKSEVIDWIKNQK